MKKKIMIIMVIIVVLVILIFILPLFDSRKSPLEHLKEKYPNIEFSYVKDIEHTKDWTSQDFLSPEKMHVVVQCGTKACRDNYYSVYNSEKITNYIYSELKKIYELSYEYKFSNSSGVKFCDNQILLTTPITDISKIDKSCNVSVVDIFVKDRKSFSKDSFKALTDNNILVNVYLISDSDYNLLSTDYRNYVSEYAYMKREEIFKTN